MREERYREGGEGLDTSGIWIKGAQCCPAESAKRNTLNPKTLRADRLVTYFVGKLQNPREEMATEESGRMWLWRDSYFPNPGTAMETGRMALTQFTNSVDCPMPPTGPGRWGGTMAHGHLVGNTLQFLV